MERGGGEGSWGVEMRRWGGGKVVERWGGEELERWGGGKVGSWGPTFVYE